MADQTLLETISEIVPGALVLLNEDRVILERNVAAVELTPELKVGLDVWEAMGCFANDEKIDRIMRGERLVLSSGEDRPALQWMLTEKRPQDGLRVLMAWDAETTDAIIQGRITFIMGASHELRSPLTALLGFAEILELESSTLTPAQAEAVSVIRRNAEHLNSMLDDVIDLSRNSFGELRLELIELDIGETVLGVCETLRPQIEARGQSLKMAIEPDLQTIKADRHRVRQIVFNLLQNAHKYTPEGTTITVSVREAKNGILLAVKDDGPGLPFENPEDSLRSFRRGPHEGVAEIAGSGIGLTITNQVVDLHRGHINIKTKPGEGTTFEVWIPRDRHQARKLVKPKPVGALETTILY